MFRIAFAVHLLFHCNSETISVLRVGVVRLRVPLPVSLSHPPLLFLFLRCYQKYYQTLPHQSIRNFPSETTLQSSSKKPSSDQSDFHRSSSKTESTRTPLQIGRKKLTVFTLSRKVKVLSAINWLD